MRLSCALRGDRVSDNESNGLVTTADLAKAAAEVQGAEAAGQVIPSLDENGSAVPVVPVPVPAHLPQTSSSPPRRVTAADGVKVIGHGGAAGVERADSAGRTGGAARAAAPARPGLLSRLLGRKKARARVASGKSAEPRPPLVLRLLDLLLAIINKPFGFLSPGLRQVVGLAAIITLAIAAVTAAIAPLAPRHDAIRFLKEKRAELDRPSPAAADAREAKSKAGH